MWRSPSCVASISFACLFYGELCAFAPDLGVEWDRVGVYLGTNT